MPTQPVIATVLVQYVINSNWTFIALNLPFTKGLRFNISKTVNQYLYRGTERGQAQQGTRGVFRLVCLGVELRLKLLRGHRRGTQKYHQEEHSTQWEHQRQSYNQTERLLSRKLPTF